MNEPLDLAAAGFFGLCIGSFLNVVIYRLPLGQSLATPPSRCRNCGYSLRWFDNIPVLSWALLRGRCRRCGISVVVAIPERRVDHRALFVRVVCRRARALLFPSAGVILIARSHRPRTIFSRTRYAARIVTGCSELIAPQGDEAVLALCWRRHLMQRAPITCAGERYGMSTQ